jgi:hypothetical protein
MSGSAYLHLVGAILSILVAPHQPFKQTNYPACYLLLLAYMEGPRSETFISFISSFFIASHMNEEQSKERTSMSTDMSLTSLKKKRTK